nr:hypothetical protein [Tanacetum cinerariifolium]
MNFIVRLNILRLTIFMGNKGVVGVVVKGVTGQVVAKTLNPRMGNTGDAAMEGSKAISKGNTGDEGAADKEVIGPDVAKTLSPPYLIQSGSLSMEYTGWSCILMLLVIRLRAKMVVPLRMKVNRKLEANVPNEVDYDVWLPLALVMNNNLVMAVSNLEGTRYVKETICVEYESEPPRCCTCLIFGHSLEDCPKAPKRLVNMIDKGKVRSSRADDKCFIEVKKKKSSCNNRGNKNFKSVLVKPKIQYRPKAKQSTKGASLKTTPYAGKKNVLTLEHHLTVKGLIECKVSASNLRRIQVKDIVKEVEDYLQTYSSAGMDISCSLILSEGLYKFACKLDSLSSLLVQRVAFGRLRDAFHSVIYIVDSFTQGRLFRGIHEHLQGVPIEEDMSTLRLRMGMAEVENASLHGKIRTMKAIETVTRSQERRARMEMERQLASV